MYKKNIIIVVSILLFSLSYGQSASKLTASAYAAEATNLLNIDEGKIYYLTDNSGSIGENYAKNGFSFLTFINGKQSANVKVIQNTCGISDITKKVVEDNLSKPNQFKDLIFKNLLSRKKLEDDGSKIIAVLFYKKEFVPLLGDYVKELKRLEKNEGIPFIVLTLDGKNAIKGIDDIADQLF